MKTFAWFVVFMTAALVAQQPSVKHPVTPAAALPQSPAGSSPKTEVPPAPTIPPELRENFYTAELAAVRATEAANAANAAFKAAATAAAKACGDAYNMAQDGGTGHLICVAKPVAAAPAPSK